MGQNEKNNNNFIKQGSILAAASIIVRLIGLIYRIPMNNIIGRDGASLYSVAFDIYDILLIISSYSLPVALSKMVSGKMANREYKNANRIFHCALFFALVTGGLASAFLFFCAGFIEDTVFTAYSGVYLPLRILAPTIFIVAFLGVFRGFFQGKKTMIPTSVSQILEQVVNAFVSIFAAYSLMTAHNMSRDISAWGAAGGTLGTCIGALTALLFLLFLYSMYRPLQRKKMKRDQTKELDSYTTIYFVLFATIIPIILSQTVNQISGIIDYTMFGKIIPWKNPADSVKALQGTYGAIYKVLISVPIAISVSISASMVPSSVSSYETGDLNGVCSKLRMATRFNMIIAFPCTIGLTLLGKPIVQMLFPSFDSDLAGRMFLIGSVAVIFYAISNVTGAILQSINQVKLPAIHAGISLIIHVIIVFILMRFTGSGIHAIVIGNVIFPIVVSILNYRAILKYLDYEQEYIKTFCIPFLSSVTMGIAILISYYGLKYIISSNIICTCFSILVAVIVYFATFLLLKGFSKEDILRLPMGNLIYRIAHTLHLIK